MITYEFHRYADLYPLASEDELARLTEDIRKNGLANPIVLYQDHILDGRNRYIACRHAGVEPRYQKWEDVCHPNFAESAGNENAALHWVVSQNSHRRHLSTSQLAMVAAKIAKVYQENAKQRSLGNLKRGD